MSTPDYNIIQRLARWIEHGLHEHPLLWLGGAINFIVYSLLRPRYKPLVDTLEEAITENFFYLGWFERQPFGVVALKNLDGSLKFKWKNDSHYGEDDNEVNEQNAC